MLLPTQAIHLYKDAVSQNKGYLECIEGRFPLPSYAKFNQSDPQRDWDWLRPHTPNLYEYCDNDPVNAWDPMGLTRSYFRDVGSVVEDEAIWWEFWRWGEGEEYYVVHREGQQEYDGSTFAYVVDEAAVDFLLSGDFRVESLQETVQSFVAFNMGSEQDQIYLSPNDYSEAMKNSPQGQSWDLKFQVDLDTQNTIYIFDGKGHAYDSIGTLTWGAVMKYHGWPMLLSIFTSAFDDPRDTGAIGMGYMWFNRDVRKKLLQKSFFSEVPQ
ncbi:MAG: hypothetical protein CR997_09605 [Acidobacteria bacterium]|nr:MAG: hypothetical protein CR997_09605 [Acidobacteriota bacterium]